MIARSHVEDGKGHAPGSPAPGHEDVLLGEPAGDLVTAASGLRRGGVPWHAVPRVSGHLINVPRVNQLCSEKSCIVQVTDAKNRITCTRRTRSRAAAATEAATELRSPSQGVNESYVTYGLT